MNPVTHETLYEERGSSSVSAFVCAAVYDTLKRMRVHKLRYRNLPDWVFHEALYYEMLSKIDEGLYEPGDFKDQMVLEAAAEYLAEKYPGINLSRKHGSELLKELAYKRGDYVVLMRRAIRTSLRAAKLDPIQPEKLKDKQYIDHLEKALSKLYPQLDLSIDPTKELTEGVLNEEMDRVIDELATC